jgi:glutaredoxin 2
MGMRERQGKKRMKLYIKEHCPFSTRARTIFGLKKLPIELSVIMEGDAATPTGLVGRKVVPILQKDDGTAMAESMDIVRYVDELKAPKLLTGPKREDIESWCEEARPIISRLAIPRMTRSTFKENGTEAARQAYVERETNAFGDLTALFEETPTFLSKMTPLLQRLEALIDDWHTWSESDLILYSTLRTLSIVKPITFSPKAKSFAEKVSSLGGVETLFDRAI